MRSCPTSSGGRTSTRPVEEFTLPNLASVIASFSEANTCGWGAHHLGMAPQGSGTSS